MTVEEFKEAWFKSMEDCPYQIVDTTEYEVKVNISQLPRKNKKKVKNLIKRLQELCKE